MSLLLNQPNQILVQQVKEWGEILIGWETTNKYKILDLQKKELGYVAERKLGFISMFFRQFLGSHRPLEVDVFNSARQAVIHMSRKFFFFFSSMHVTTVAGEKVGRLRRRFSIFSKRYDLEDSNGAVFATINSPIWKIWKFPIIDAAGIKRGVITKKWGGLLKEAFTDSDCFLVDYGEAPWTDNQKDMILAVAITIDFDFFEENELNAMTLVADVFNG